MALTPSATYTPKTGYPEALSTLSAPKIGSADFDMVVYWQWTRHWWKNKTHDEAWIDLRMSPANARKAIEDRIVPPEIYDKVLARSKEA